MAFDGTDPCWNADLPVGVKQTPRVRIAQFGDGYEQRMADGINYMTTTYDLSWATREQSIVLAMDDFLSTRAARAFDWQHPVTKEIIRVFCDDWNINWNFRHKPPGAPDRLTYGTLTATFRVAYGEAVT